MNGHYLNQLNQEEREKFLIPFMREAGFDVSDQQRTGKIIEAVYKRLSYGKEIVRETALFFENSLEIQEQEARVVLHKETSRKVLSAFLEKAKDHPELKVDDFKNLMKEIQQETGIKKDELWMPIRVALTGVTHGPDLPLVIEILGKQKIISLTKQALHFEK